MYCKKCGNQLGDDCRYCPNCGALNDAANPNLFNQYGAPPQSYSPYSASESNPCAIAGFIFAFLIPIVGLVLSIIGRKKQQYRGLATAGLVISIVEMVVAFILTMIIISLYSDITTEIYRLYRYAVASALLK